MEAREQQEADRSDRIGARFDGPLGEAALKSNHLATICGWRFDGIRAKGGEAPSHLVRVVDEHLSQRELGPPQHRRLAVLAQVDRVVVAHLPRAPRSNTSGLTALRCKTAAQKKGIVAAPSRRSPAVPDEFQAQRARLKGRSAAAHLDDHRLLGELGAQPVPLELLPPGRRERPLGVARALVALPHLVPRVPNRA